ncbi:MAG: TatD family hydrolase [Candidatus Omnitrophica bacterium]|nr:TatD family hydrolase [Candidatus Omnitrophota bacterium]
MIDAHTHLFFNEFKDDFKNVVDRAREAGIQYLINVGTNDDTSLQAIELAQQYDFMYATVGVHPNEANNVKPHALVQFGEWLEEEPKVVAVGEIGLDYYRNTVPHAVQRETLIQFFGIAERHKRPIVLHIRDAYEDTIKILRDYFQPPIRGMAHCFSGTPDHMEELVQLGLYVSFAGPVTYPKNDTLREAARRCPVTRILVETDAPYLPPQSLRGKRNEPSYVLETARQIASLKGMSEEAFGKQMVENARHLFGF